MVKKHEHDWMVSVIYIDGTITYRCCVCAAMKDNRRKAEERAA